MSGRQVISSPFQFAGNGPQPQHPSAQTCVNTSVSSPAKGKYAPPPSITEVQQEVRSQPPPPASSRATFPPPASGGKLSAFAELSNKAPPPLYEVDANPPPVSASALKQPSQVPISITQKPSPCNVIPNADPSQVEQFLTNNTPVPPPAARNYIVIDQGNCSPRFMRSSTYNIPTNSKLANETGIPLGIVVHPLAEPQPKDTQIPLVQPKTGIYRCTRCGAFHNALDKYTQQGHKYLCFLCSFENEVPDDFYSPLGMDGFRIDLNHRPELYSGTVEYVAPSEYIVKPPAPLSVVFTIETSLLSKETGSIQAFCESVGAILRSLPKNSPIRVAFVTFNEEIHFYNLHGNRTTPQVLVMTDVENNFLPTGQENLLVSYHSASEVIHSFLSLLPSFCNTEASEICTAAAIRSSGLLLKQTGGKVVIFQSSLPSKSPGALINRYKEEYLGTSRERELYVPHNSYFSAMGTDCSNHNISFELFVIPKERSYVDVASISPLVRLTGGQLYYYPNFTYQKDRLTIHNELFRLLTRTNGIGAIVRVRASTGVEVSNYRGFFQLKHGHDMHFSNITCDTTLCADLQITETLPDESFIGLQCAVLYTTSFGEKRIRVHSLRLPTSQHAGKVVAAADLDAILFLNCSRYLKMTFKKDLKVIRERAINDIVQVLLKYRKKCATNSIGLALPDSLQLLPLYQLCMLKTSLLKDTRVSVDYRLAERMKIYNMSLSDFSIYLYPRLFALHQLQGNWGDMGEYDSVILPPWQPLTKETLQVDGCYLLDSPTMLLLWVGRRVHPDFLAEVFGVSSLMSSEAAHMALSVGDTPLLRKIHNIIHAIRTQHVSYPPLYIILQGGPQDLAFNFTLREDRVEDTMSHADFLAFLNQQIAQKLSS